MFCSGVIAEYNPFHNGHMHHLRETINIAGNPNVIAVMSGSFVQRGSRRCLISLQEPAWL